MRTLPQTKVDATRVEILRHAQDLFEHYGFTKTTIGDIADRCQMSPGNLYRYYRNKQAIGLAVVQTYFDMVETAMEAELMLPEGTPEDRIRRFIEMGISHLVAELERSPKIVELADFLCNDEHGIELLDRHVSWKRERLEREIRRGIAEGQFQDGDATELASTLLITFKAFWIPMSLATWRDKSTIIPEMRAILDLVFRGLKK